MAETTNQAIADALVERQLRAGRVEAGWRREVWAALLVLEADLLAAIKVADPTEFALLTRRRREVEALMAETLEPLIAAWYLHTGEHFDRDMGRLAQSEAEAVQRIVNREADREVIEETPPDTALRRRVAGALFPSASKPTDASATGSEWWTRQGESLTQRIGDTLHVSVSQEETLTQMTQRVRGTSEQNFTDGVMERARQDASRLLRTQTTNAIGEARADVARRNPQRLVLIHQSILDSRTSTICLARNGLRFEAEEPHDPLGHSIPYLNGPPYHNSCRSSMVTALDDGGRVADQTVTQWLRNRDTAYQDAVLGPTRARMWREGKLSPRDLIDALTGRPLTLDELGTP